MNSVEHNFHTHDIKKTVLEGMQAYEIDTRDKVEMAAMQLADDLLPAYTNELFEAFYSLRSVSGEYESRHGLGWMDVVDAVRDIVAQAYADIACEVINEYECKGDE
jgi:hypothetical protein